MIFRSKSEDSGAFKRRLGSSYVALPCGQCHGCRLERSRQWAVRCLHESTLHAQNCFITLTYDDANLPTNGSLYYPDFQKFVRSLRDAGYIFRYYMAGEYGSNFDRPHYHSILFGMHFPDKTYFGKGEAGFEIYKSAT